MGCMVVGLMEGTSQTWMTQLEVVDGWIHLKGEVVVMGSILVLVQTGIMAIIIIILTQGVTGGTFQMSLRKPKLLHLMES